MVKKDSRRQTVKTLNLIKSNDIIVDKLLKPCQDGVHAKCTGWAVLKKELSPINANYFRRCTCKCHHHHHRKEKEQQKVVSKEAQQKTKKKSSSRKQQHIKKQKLNKTNRKAKSSKR